MLKILFFSLYVIAHPVHVSLMSVEYSETSGAFNVFLKIYTDDFLLDYKLLTSDTSKIDFTVNKLTAEKNLARYLKEKVQIYADGKMLNHKLVNLDSSDGELKVGLVSDNLKKSKNFLVKNMIMTSLYNDQANLLIFKYGEKEESVKLTADRQEQTFTVK